MRDHEFDAIVVGSGPAGATVARDLSKRKKKVLILERGGNGPVREGFGMAPILNNVAVGDDLSCARAFTTGGTTAVYFAVADPPPLDLFRSAGVDLAADFEEAKRELPLNVVPEALLGPQAIRTRQSAEELGYPCQTSTMLVDLAKCESGYSYEAKWKARSYVMDAIEHGATLIAKARVLKVLVEDGRAVGVEYRLQRGRKDFETRRAYGAKVVLAAGGAASPLLLRESGIRDVGSRGFYCHPGFAMFGTARGLKAGENFIGSTGTVVDGDIAVGDGNPARVFYRMLMLGNGKWFRAFRHSSSIGVGVMINDGMSGELREDGRFDKKLTAADRGKLAKGEEVARRILHNAGARSIVKLKPFASHIGGAVRIGEHVDAKLETAVRNLHVCDGSVIPATVRLSPTLTLVCLGKYLARQI